MAWTYFDNYDLLPNIYVRHHFKDGVLSHYQLYPCDGYVIRIPINDYELGKRSSLADPYYTKGGCTATKDYDFVTNPIGYEATPSK